MGESHSIFLVIYCSYGYQVKKKYRIRRLYNQKIYKAESSLTAACTCLLISASFSSSFSLHEQRGDLDVIGSELDLGRDRHHYFHSLLSHLPLLLLLADFDTFLFLQEEWKGVRNREGGRVGQRAIKRGIGRRWVKGL